MILKYNFLLVLDNGILQSILHKILQTMSKKHQIVGKIESFSSEVNLYIDGEEKNLLNFSDEISNLLPISLFYLLHEVTVVEEAKENELGQDSVSIPFSHFELQEVLKEDSKEYFNPFIAHFIGKGSKGKPPLSFRYKNETIDASLTKTYKEVIQKTANHLKDGAIFDITLSDGIKNVGVVGESLSKDLKGEEFVIIPCDLSLVKKMLIASNEEIKALASLEKPTLNLHVNLIYQNKNFLPFSWVDVKFSDSLLLLLLCRELFRLGVEFIYAKNGERKENYLLHEVDEFTKSMHINVLEDKSVSVVKNDPFIPPPMKQKIPNLNKKSYKQFTALMYEHSLFDKRNICFFLSKKFDDSIIMYDEKNGFLDLLKLQIPTSFKELFEDIKSSDETGERLFSNYEKNFPDLIKKAYSVKIPDKSPQNFYTLLGIVGVVLGFGGDVKSAAFNLVLNAKEFGGLKGPRLDVRLEKERFPAYVDVIRFVKSGMSFKLASVEDRVLSFGYMESIGYFISNLSDTLAKEYECEDFMLLGELFEFKRLYELGKKDISPNHNFYQNKIFPLE